MHLAFSSLFSLNATSAVKSIAIIDSRACMVMRSRPLALRLLRQKLLRVDKYLRTHGPVVEKQIYTQDLNGIDQILQNLFRLWLAPSTKIL